VEKETVESAVAAWLPSLGLPPQPAAGVKDLKGRGVRVAKFTDEETLRFFFPRRTLPFEQHMVKALTAQLRRRGAKIESVPLTTKFFEQWCRETRAEDTPETRYRFATSPPALLLELGIEEGGVNIWRDPDDGTFIVHASQSLFAGDEPEVPITSDAERTSRHNSLRDALESRLGKGWAKWGVFVLDPSIQDEFLALGGFTPKQCRQRRIGR